MIWWNDRLGGREGLIGFSPHSLAYSFLVFVIKWCRSCLPVSHIFSSSLLSSLIPRREWSLSLSWSQKLENQERRISSFCSFTASSSLYNHQIKGRKEREGITCCYYSRKKSQSVYLPLLSFLGTGSSLFLVHSYAGRFSFFSHPSPSFRQTCCFVLLPIRQRWGCISWLPGSSLSFSPWFVGSFSLMSLFFLLHVLFLNSSKLLIKGSSLLQWVFLVWAVPPHHRHNFFSVFILPLLSPFSSSPHHVSCPSSPWLHF